MMKSILTVVWVGAVIILSISSCATVPTEPLGSDELRLLRIHPEEGDIRVNFPFLVNINFEADGKPEIRTACFSFSEDGPYYYKVSDVNYGSPGTIKVQVRAKNSGSQALESYVFYIKVTQRASQDGDYRCELDIVSLFCHLISLLHS